MHRRMMPVKWVPKVGMKVGMAQAQGVPTVCFSLANSPVEVVISVAV